MIAIIILNCPIVEMSRPMPAHVKHLQCPDGPICAGTDCLLILALSLTHRGLLQTAQLLWASGLGHSTTLEGNCEDGVSHVVPETRNHSDGRANIIICLIYRCCLSGPPSWVSFQEGAETERLVLITLQVPRAVQGSCGLFSSDIVNTQQANSPKRYPQHPSFLILLRCTPSLI